MPIAVKVTAASASDQAGARKLFAEAKNKLQSIKKIWVDGTSRGEAWHRQVKEQYGIELEVKKNETGVRGYARASQTMGGGADFRVVRAIAPTGA